VKIVIQHEDLQKALNIVAGIVPGKSTMPILTCILVETAEDGVRFSATNLDISATTLVEKASVKRKGRVAIPAAKFVAFSRSLSPGEVAIEEKGGKVSVVSGKSALEEPGMNADEFPALPVLAEGKGLEMPARTLADMVKSAAYAVSRDETRPALMGILWEAKPDRLRFVATDAHRLSRVETPLKLAGKEARSVIGDANGLQHFVRLAEGAETVQVHLGASQLSFRIGPTQLHTRLLEGPFPDYEAVIPKHNNKIVTADREALAQAVRRVSISADRITSQIRLGIENGRLELLGIGSDGSRAEDEVPVSYEGEAIEIGFNYNYLQDILRNLRAETIQIAIKDAQSAALIVPAEKQDDVDVLCLLMPLRLTAD
jgi:DNA polymerase-3 subunit beta